jgi:selenide,water dikinase
VLRHLPPILDPRVLIGAETSDDAAVYRLSDEQALVATIDYITPVVDDPYLFGQIAAANALSDIYAMGARPILALNVVNFPRETLPLEVLGEIVRGGADKATEAGIAILGGHSVDDPEPKYGLVVLGLVHPERIVANRGALAGDTLVLTKPLGIGIITTAIKRDAVDQEVIAQACTSMATLNRAASEAMVEVGVHAATDVTGFGLLGHLAEMLRASNRGAQITAAAVPLLPRVLTLARAGLVPGGSQRNLATLGDFVRWPSDVDEATQLVLADAQTSGGLLMSVDAGRVPALLSALSAREVQGVVVGQVTAGAEIEVV